MLPMAKAGKPIHSPMAGGGLGPLPDEPVDGSDGVGATSDPTEKEVDGDPPAPLPLHLAIGFRIHGVSPTV